MDDLTQKLQTLLSDPESMQDLAELAAMLREPEGGSDAAGQPASAADADGLPQMDFSRLIAVGQALSSVQNDETSALILALKPYLSAERAKRADQAVRLLKLYAAAGVLRESGMLTDLI